MVVVIDSVAMTFEMVFHGFGMYAIGVIMVVRLCCVDLIGVVVGCDGL